MAMITEKTMNLQKEMLELYYDLAEASNAKTMSVCCGWDEKGDIYAGFYKDGSGLHTQEKMKFWGSEKAEIHREMLRLMAELQRSFTEDFGGAIPNPSQVFLYYDLEKYRFWAEYGYESPYTLGETALEIIKAWAKRADTKI